MEPKFQTSFIPKSPMTSPGTSGFVEERPFSIIGTLSTVLFIVTLIASAGVYGYSSYIQSQIQVSQNKLAEARTVFESPDNQKIILISDQLKSIRVLLSNHTVVSPLFEFLEKETLPTVRLTSFTFARGAKGDVQVNIEGDAQSYASLAQQFKIFSDLPYLSSISFTDINLTETGTINMKMKAMINSDVLLYSKKMQALSVIDNSF